MFRYILKRLLYFVPTFVAITVITFMLGQIAPGDPVELKLKGGLQSANQQASDKFATEKAYLELSEKYGRHLPAFYFSISSKAVPDTLYRIRRKADRENLERLIDKYGNWNQISNYYYRVRDLEVAVLNMPEDTIDEGAFERKKTVRNICNVLYINSDDNEIQSNLKHIEDEVNAVSVITTEDSQQINHRPLIALSDEFSAVKNAYEKVKSEQTTSANLIPAIHWYGTENQYHRWLFGDAPWFGGVTDITKSYKGFFRGELGKSFVDDREVTSIISEALKWTLLLNIIIVLLIYIISIPVGVSLSIKNNTSYDRVVTLILFICYSLPTVWIGTLMITFLTSDYYGDSLNIFPPYGLGKVGEEYGTWEKITDRAYHFVLPVVTLVIGSFAYISRQMRGSMLSVVRQDYIRTAFAKGLPPKTVYWKHAFRNSLIPIITIFSSLLPAMISGSVIVEYMFNIPGMGRVSYDAVVQRDYPVLFTILLFSAILTMLGNLLADILYAGVDPRISFNKKM